MGHVGIYGTYTTDKGYALIVCMNLVFALSATITLFYLIFYSISPKSRKLLEILHYSGILVLAAYLALIIVIYEFRDGKIGGRDQ